MSEARCMMGMEMSVPWLLCWDMRQIMEIRRSGFQISSAAPRLRESYLKQINFLWRPVSLPTCLSVSDVLPVCLQHQSLPDPPEETHSYIPLVSELI